ncbi:MAG: hypothetical protein K8U57_12005 [Planctomycetes bacterium]|nr:hypothetical protein [Planctomycetota bacterium]
MNSDGQGDAERPHPGDVLPNGARVRLGTNRLNHICYRSANSGLCCLVFSPDSQYLIGLGYDDDEATLWEVPSGREVWRFVSDGPWGGNRGNGGAAFSPDSRLVAVDGGTARVFEVATGRMVMQLDTGSSAYGCFMFSPCGRFLAQVVFNRVLVLAVETWKVVATLEANDPEVRGHEMFDSVAFSPDGRLLAAASCRVWVWEWATGELVNRFEPPDSAVSVVRFLPDGQVAVAVRDGTLRLWEPATGRELRCHQCAEGHDNTWPAVFRADGRVVAIPGRWTVVLDTETGTELGRYSGYTCSVFALSPNGQLVANAWLGRVELVDTATGDDVSPPGRHSERSETIVFSDDGRRVLTAEHSGTGGFLWDVASGRLIAPAPPLGRALENMAFASQGSRAVCYEKQKLHLWDIETGQLREFPLPDNPSAVAWMADGEGVVVAAEGQLSLHAFEGNPSGVLFEPVGEAIRSLRSLADGRVVGLSSGQAYVWGADGRLLVGAALPLVESWVRRLFAVSADGLMVAVYGRDTVDVFATEPTHRAPDEGISASSLPFTIPAGFGDAPYRGLGITAEFLADSRLLVAACRGESDDGEPLVVKVWEAATELEVWESPAFPCGIAEVVFAPGGRTLAIALDDATTVLFDVPVRPVELDPSWRSSTAVALARGIDAEGAFDRLPILADALQDAGCEDEELLAHL